MYQYKTDYEDNEETRWLQDVKFVFKDEDGEFYSL
jgi:hypothetical protein